MIEKHTPKKIAAIGFFSNVMEWYDFAVYAFLANVIGDLFFPGENKELSLIKALFLFSIGYLVRPIGSIFFGYIADKFGRKISLKISLFMMAIPTFFIGLLPTYKTAGILSVVLLIILRVIQGFSAGGELPVSSCYIYEVSPNLRKNFFSSFVASSSMFGVFVGSLVAYLLHVIFSDIQIHAWAWRIPFLIGGITALVVFKLRNFIEETDQFKSSSIKDKKEFLSLLFTHKIQILQVFFLNAFISTAFYLLFVWMPLYLKTFMNISSRLAYFSSSLGLLILISLTLFIGFISKDHQRKRWIIAGIIVLLTTVYPLFSLINHKVFIIILLAQIVFAIGLSLIDGVINATMGSLFNNEIRCSGISIGFTFSTAVFGGLAPTICSFLIYKSGSHLSPILFLVITGIIALCTTISLRQHDPSLLHK